MDLMQRRRQIMMGASPLIEMTATGNPAVFTSKARKAYTSLKAGFLPVQDLHGYDHPWPAGGGVNKYDGETVVGRWKNVDGTFDISATGWTSSKNVISVTAGNSNYINMIAYRIYYDANMNYVGYDASGTYVAITPADAVYMHISQRTDEWSNNVIVAISSTEVPFEPYSNICPITGWTGVTVTRTGKNLIPNIKYQFNSQNVFLGASSSSKNLHLIPGSYTMKIYGTATGTLAFSSDANTTPTQISGNQNVYTFTIPVGSNYNFWLYRSGGISASDITQFQLELGSTATSYEPYTGTTVSVDWTSEAGTVYGGTLDVTTGVLTVNMASVDLGTLTWVYSSAATYPRFAAMVAGAKGYNGGVTAKGVCSVYPIVSQNEGYSGAKTKCIAIVSDGYVWAWDSAYTDTESFKTAMSGVQLVYELATPITYTLTAQQIQALLGTNTVFSDANDSIEVKYLTRN